MSKCDSCSKMMYRGFRLDGWPSTIYGYCDDYGHDRPADCALFSEGEPRYYDRRGIEVSRERLDAVPDRMA